MRVLITGSGGFLGRYLTPLLAAHDVLCLVRSTEGNNTSAVRQVAGDLTTDGPWQQAVEEFAPEWCFHLAWDGLPDYSLERCRANLDANVGLIQTLARAGVRRVVVAGTCWEYGRTHGPQREDATPVDCGVFAATKHAVRAMLDAVARECGFDYRWARVFFAYGAGQRGSSLIPHLRDSLTSGTPPAVREPAALQDFIHVADVARGLLALAQCDAASGVYNLGSGEATSVGAVANLVARHYGRSPAFAATSTGTGFWADMSRTTAATGWRPTTGLAAGIDLTLRAMDEAA